MKPLLSAITTALIFSFAQDAAEQTTQSVVTSCNNVAVAPISQGQSLFDLNHMGTNSDKLGALGVPYYDQHAMQLLPGSDHRV